MAAIRQKTAPVREKRLGSLSAWYGSVASLVREAEAGELIPRIRSFAQDAESDLAYALDLLATIRDAAIVVHGPAGCAASLHAARGAAPNWLVTDIGERDSILGGDAKLRAAILAAHARFLPRAIFVVSTPVVIINNDDIETVSEELREALGLPVVPVYADGFRSRIAATGLDVVVHALVRHLVPDRAVAGQGAVGLLSLRENPANLAALRGLLGEIGLQTIGFPRHATVDELARIAAAPLLVSLNPGEGGYAGQVLAEALGIPHVAPPAPLGLGATASWLAAVARESGRAAQADSLIGRESARLSALIEGAHALRGRRVFLHLQADHALGLWQLARDLGLEVVGIKLPYLDPAHVPALRDIASLQENLPLLVGEGQAFEEIALLRSARPDLYIGPAAHLLPAARLGIATLPLDDLGYLGFDGVEKLLRQVARRLANPSFQRFLAEGESEPYSQNWRQKSAYWHIKHEVR